MKLSKKQEQEIMQVYDTWMNSYLNGDVKTYDSFLDDGYRFIGSTDNEEFLNRKDTTQFFKDTAEQFSGKTDLRKQTKTIEAFDDLIFITHLFDAWFINGSDWTYYGRFRFSSVLQEKKEGWKFIYQHFSIADSKTDEGETIGFDKVNEENQALREAIKRRTVEVEQKNRELEIETALEKVRARTMAMQKSEELAETSMILFNQLLVLGLKPRACGFLIMDEESQTMDDWSANVDEHGKGIHVNSSIAFDQHPLIRRVVETWQKGDPYFIGGLHGEELQKYHDAVTLKETSSSTIKEKVLSVITSEYTNSFYFEYGMLYVLTAIPLTDNEINVLLRFAGVLKLTYRRFLDLQKAEAQAKEAHIETALERVRSRSMSMHKSEELADLSLELVKQVQNLGVATWFCAFNIYDEDGKGSLEWGSNGQGTFPKYRTPREGVFLRYYEAGQRGETLLINEIDKNECPRHYEYLCSLPGVGDQLLKMKEAGIPFPSSQIDHVAFFKYGYVLFITFEPAPEAHGIFKRFAKVFEQTYTRFLDLQKAEAQAREAQIETALERVRSRSMAMHKSDELKDVVKVIFDQMAHLKIKADHAGIVVDYEPKKNFHFWVADNQDIPAKITVPYLDLPWDRQFTEAKKKGKDFFTTQLDFEEKNSFYKKLLPHIEGLTKKAKDFYFNCPGLAASTVLQKDIGLYIENFSGIPFSDEENSILMRFGKVFQQTYTRFQDLKKAEAQAREAQIEAALEKVRSRSLAMHKSDELKEVVAVVLEKLQELNIAMESRVAVIVVFKEGSRDFNQWVASPTDITNTYISTPYFEHIILSDFWKAKESGLDFYSKSYSKDQKNEYFKYFFEHSFFKNFEGIEDQKKWALEKEFYTYSPVFEKNSSLGIADFSGEPLSENEIAIIKRFAKVFEQAYIRFLDLQKAESQAREAQIEAALERVRSKTMAMHNSHEVGDTVVTLFDEVLKLGIDKSIRIGIGILEGYEGMETWSVNSTPNGKVDLKMGMLDMTIHPMLIGLKKAWKSGETCYSYDYLGNDVYRYYEALNNEPEYPFEADLDSLPENEYHKSFFYNEGILFSFAPNPISEEAAMVLSRFAGVFGQTYRRYLDLQKAEAQARESQIEAALERVRSRSMAMHESKEMLEVIGVVSEQLQQLNLNFDTVSLAKNNQEGDFTFWITSKGQPTPILMEVPTLDSPILKGVYKAQKKGIPFLADVFSAEENREWHEHLIKYSDLKHFPDKVKKFILNAPGFARSSFLLKNIDLYVGNYRAIPFTDEENSIFRRFAHVFEQSYTRFLDLQNAEAQVREAQIEGALEKVRSQSLAMHTTGEMQLVANAVYEQLHELGLEMDAVGMSGVIEAKQDYDVWVGGVPFGKALRIPYNTSTKVQRDYNKMLEERPELFAKTYSGKVKEEYINHLLTHGDFPKALKKKMKTSEAFTTSIALAKKSSIQILRYTNQPYSEEDNEIVKRFSKVFEQAYIRFMDLQKAEAQAREAQIETSLEKVRSRTMAMQKGEEVKDVVVLLYKELIALGVDNFVTCGYVEINETTNRQETWVTNPGGDSLGLFYLPLKGDATFDERYAAWKKQQIIFHQKVAGKVRSKHLEYAITTFNSKEAEEMVLSQFPDPCVFYCFNFSHGYLHLVSGSILKEEEESLLARFTRVFEQTYARFLDLKKAESQAREAQIENALEKVRSRTMAMQKSEDLPEAANDLFLQVQALGIPAWSAGYCIWETGDKKAASCNMSSEGEIQKSFILPTIGEGYNFYDPLKKGETFYIEELGGDALVKHYEFMKTLPKVGKILEELIKAGLSLPTFQIFHILYFPHGYLMFITYEQVPEAHDIFKRFAKVFEQTYTRFLDLQKAEAQAREATKQASLDRVRGQIASMRSTQDLERITPLIWNELTTLGIPFIRCGVFIIDDQIEMVQVYLSAPDGHSLGAMQLPFDADQLTANSVAHWQRGEVFKAHWNKEQFNEFMQTMIDLGQIKNKKVYQGGKQPPESLHLHFVPFTQGMLYVGNIEPLKEDQIKLVQSLADAFSIAYARYEDFTKLEKAKQSVEATLSELKATQNQLVQSEKMASLGELTAGIAHEIQNPLNFVNNFSEVSSELLEEMNEEIEKGDMEEAKAIANDVKQNLEKILHHGKRADGIVKGMLQHSRSSSGTKEPTDINVLTDEYLRLAYHGLRAKDKNFNATMKTDYDEKLEKVNVIPQDIGRVILNLITNAFYVVDEKKKELKDGYEPTVSVSTKKGANKIEVSVKDNGNGIPDKVKEKIFQPFFTTKPTGKGTGLGLSMSYDIITKGHGGELKVETTEGEGTTFTIALPRK